MTHVEEVLSVIQTSWFLCWKSLKSWRVCCLNKIFKDYKYNPTREGIFFFSRLNFPGKSTGVGCHFPFQGIILTQRLNLQFPAFPALAAGFFSIEPLGKPLLYCVLCLITQSCSTLGNLEPTRLLCSWGFSKQEYWSGLPCPPPRDLPNPGIELRCSTQPYIHMYLFSPLLPATIQAAT